MGKEAELVYTEKQGGGISIYKKIKETGLGYTDKQGGRLSLYRQTRRWSQYIQTKRRVVYTDKQGGGIITHRLTRKQVQYTTQTYKEAGLVYTAEQGTGLAALNRSNLCSGPALGSGRNNRWIFSLYTVDIGKEERFATPPSFTWERLSPYHEAEALILGVAVTSSNNTHPLRTSLSFCRDRDYRIRISGCLLYSSYKILCVTCGCKIGQRKPFMRICSCKLSSWRAKSKEQHVQGQSSARGQTVKNGGAQV